MQYVLLLLFALWVLPAHAAVDANTADQAALETVRGIGPALAARIVAARTQGGPFRDLQDLRDRVRGVGDRSLEKMVQGGLSLGGGAAPVASGVAASQVSQQASQAAVRPILQGPGGLAVSPARGASTTEPCGPPGLQLIVGNVARSVAAQSARGC